MSLILQVTRAGREQKANARLNNQALPPFTGFVIDTAITQDADAPTIDALYTSAGADPVVVSRVDSVAFKIESAIPPTAPAGWVRGVGLLTDDGIVYAYARYAEVNNGMYKPAGLGIELKLILAEDGRARVEFNYTVVDVEQIKAKLLASLAHIKVCAVRAVNPFTIDPANPPCGTLMIGDGSEFNAIKPTPLP